MHAAAVLRGVVPVPTRRVAGGVETSLHATAGCGFSRPASWRVRQSRHTGGSRGPSRFRVTRNRASAENDPAGDNTQTGKEEELDFITRMVVKVFGAGVMSDPEPMGLKRMSKSEWPDQWPALCDGSVAQLLPEDDTKELQTIRAVLAQTQLENMPLGIAYDANVHGWKASSFHTQVSIGLSPNPKTVYCPSLTTLIKKSILHISKVDCLLVQVTNITKD